MKIRKMILLLMVFFLVFSLTGCGFKKNKKTEETSQSEETDQKEDSSQSEEADKAEESDKKEDSSQSEEADKAEESDKKEDSSQAEETKTEEDASQEEKAETEEDSSQAGEIIVLGTIKIQSIEGGSLDDNPEIPMYEKANDAFEHPTIIKGPKKNKIGRISFSYIEKGNETFSSIVQARIIEKNEDVSSGIGAVSHMGEIATFTLELPEVKNATIVYQISLQNEEGYHHAFIGIKVKK